MNFDASKILSFDLSGQSSGNILEGSRWAFCCACSANFSLIRETASMRLRSPLKNRERKEVEKYVGKNSGSSIWDNLSSHFLFCNLDGSGKVLKLLRVVWKEVISKCKRLYKRLRVVSCDCLGDRCRWCYFWRMPVACRRAQTNWIVYFYSVIALSSYRWSFEVLAFL